MKKLHLIVLALSVAALLQGCDGSNHGAAQKKLRIAVVPNAANDFWSIAHHGCNLSAQLLGNVDLEFCLVTNSTMAAQQEILSNLVAGGVDGIAISPIDAEQQTDFLDQIAAKTLLVCVDSDAEKSKRACYIGTDNVAAGRQAAELVKAALPQGGKIILFVGHVNAQNARDRIQSIQSGLAGSNIQILDTLEDGTQSAMALKNAQDALANHPDLAGMVGIYSYDGPAILAAVRGAGKAGQVKIVCFDEDGETMAGVAAGDIFGTVVQKPFEFGHQTILLMDKFICGDKSLPAGGKFLFPTLAVTKESVEAYQFWRKEMFQQ